MFEWFGYSGMDFFCPLFKKMILEQDPQKLLATELKSQVAQ